MKTTEVKVLLQEIKEDLSTLRKIIIGNGAVGLVEKTRNLEEDVTCLKDDVKPLVETSRWFRMTWKILMSISAVLGISVIASVVWLAQKITTLSTLIK